MLLSVIKYVIVHNLVNRLLPIADDCDYAHKIDYRYSFLYRFMSFSASHLSVNSIQSLRRPQWELLNIFMHTDKKCTMCVCRSCNS